MNQNTDTIKFPRWTFRNAATYTVLNGFYLFLLYLLVFEGNTKAGNAAVGLCHLFAAIGAFSFLVVLSLHWALTGKKSKEDPALREQAVDTLMSAAKGGVAPFFVGFIADVLVVAAFASEGYGWSTFVAIVSMILWILKRSLLGEAYPKAVKFLREKELEAEEEKA